MNKVETVKMDVEKFEILMDLLIDLVRNKELDTENAFRVMFLKAYPVAEKTVRSMDDINQIEDARTKFFDFLDAYGDQIIKIEPTGSVEYFLNPEIEVAYVIEEEPLGGLTVKMIEVRYVHEDKIILKGLDRLFGQLVFDAEKCDVQDEAEKKRLHVELCRLGGELFSLCSLVDTRAARKKWRKAIGALEKLDNNYLDLIHTKVQEGMNV